MTLSARRRAGRCDGQDGVGGVEEQVDGGSEIVDAIVHGLDDDFLQADSEPAAHEPERARLRRQPAGVNTPGTARNSTVNGLPQGAINMTSTA